MRKIEIGNATLYHGVCLEILPTLGSVDLIVADPPYMMTLLSDYTGKISPWADICNAASWYRDWFELSRSTLSETGALWSFLNWRTIPTYLKAACDAKWKVESLLVWDKKHFGAGGVRGLRPSYEMVALLCGEKFAVPNRSIRDVQQFAWSAAKPNGHPAEKPVDLIAWLIGISSQPGGTVADWFMGSGTTGVAAIRSGRKFIGIEQDPKWFDYACERIRKAT